MTMTTESRRDCWSQDRLRDYLLLPQSQLKLLAVSAAKPNSVHTLKRRIHLIVD
jgi:hypothetical protein